MLKIIRDNPKAFLLAVVVHALMIVALSFSIDWTSKHKTAASDVQVIQAVMIDESKIKAEAERMRKLEQEKRRKLEADKRRKTEQDKKRKEAEAKKRREAEKRKQAELKKKQEVEKKRKAEAETKRKKAKAEAKRKEEARKKQEAEAKRKEEARKKQEAEKIRKEEAERKRKAEEERKRQEEVAKLRAEEDRIRQEQIAAEQAAMESARQQALVSERDKYIGLIQRRVESKWVRPSDWRTGITCMVNVQLVPGAGGTAQVMNASMVKSCGNPLFDRSVENAVFSASPLPFPTSPELMNEFRRFNLNFDPKE